MENSLDLKIFDENDVIAFKSKVFKVGHFLAATEKALKNESIGVQFKNVLNSQGCNISVGESVNNRWIERNERWFTQGVSCELLQPKSDGWRKGKLKITFNVEFIPDEPEDQETSIDKQIGNIYSESPLDDIRQQISEEGDRD